MFEPDFVFIGFCMNDPLEPFVVGKNFGGVERDYHGITQVSSTLISYLLNETGYGRLGQKFQLRHESLLRERFKEIGWVEDIAPCSVDDPKFSENWKMVLSYLDKIYKTAKNEKIGVVLLIFPHTFQLTNDTLKEPQRILIRHAKEKKVDVIDFTTVFERLIFDKRVTELLRKNGFSYDEIHKLYEKRIRKYFLDQDHYTVEGHYIVASQIYLYLSSYFT